VSVASIRLKSTLPVPVASSAPRMSVPPGLLMFVRQCQTAILRSVSEGAYALATGRGRFGADGGALALYCCDTNAELRHRALVPGRDEATAVNVAKFVDDYLLSELLSVEPNTALRVDCLGRLAPCGPLHGTVGTDASPKRDAAAIAAERQKQAALAVRRACGHGAGPGAEAPFDWTMVSDLSASTDATALALALQTATASFSGLLGEGAAAACVAAAWSEPVVIRDAVEAMARRRSGAIGADPRGGGGGARGTAARLSIGLTPSPRRDGAQAFLAHTSWLAGTAPGFAARDQPLPQQAVLEATGVNLDSWEEDKSATRERVMRILHETQRRSVLGTRLGLAIAQVCVVSSELTANRAAYVGAIRKFVRTCWNPDVAVAHSAKRCSRTRGVTLVTDTGDFVATTEPLQDEATQMQDLYATFSRMTRDAALVQLAAAIPLASIAPIRLVRHAGVPPAWTDADLRTPSPLARADNGARAGGVLEAELPWTTCEVAVSVALPLVRFYGTAEAASAAAAAAAASSRLDTSPRVLLVECAVSLARRESYITEQLVRKLRIPDELILCVDDETQKRLCAVNVAIPCPYHAGHVERADIVAVVVGQRSDGNGRCADDGSDGGAAMTDRGAALMLGRNAAAALGLSMLTHGRAFTVHAPGADSVTLVSRQQDYLFDGAAVTERVRTPDAAKAHADAVLKPIRDAAASRAAEPQEQRWLPFGAQGAFNSL
jgi:hypothetical protein